jgi:DNA-binding IclR family transcriptional regulator
VSKALSLLTTLAGSPNGTLGVSELALASGLPKSTAHRLLQELQAHDLVDRDGSRYCVGNGLMMLYAAVRRSSHGQLRDLAQPALSWLFERTQYTVHLGVLYRTRVLYVEKITGRDGTRIPSRVGDTMPLTCTSLGKALLALSPQQLVRATLNGPLPRRTPYSILNRQVLLNQLAQTRSTGLAYDREESRLGISCVASPVMVGTRAVAAVSIAGLTTTFDPRHGRELLAAAAQIAKAVAAHAADTRLGQSIREAIGQRNASPGDLQVTRAG